MSKQISFKALVSADQAAAYLEDLARSLRAGTVTLSQGDQHVVLSPQETLGLELEAAEKKDKQKLSLELSWRLVVETPLEAGGLVISSEKPEVTTPATAPDDDELDDDEPA